jgi:6-pyruvoyltetrahydropterin/6-carboxytetrahydropterin synthase
MYRLSVEKSISTAHRLNDYQGPCARIHGHNWRIRLDVLADKLDQTGIAIDFSDLENILWHVIGRFDHQLLNDVPPFDQLNPTAENIARYVYQEAQKQLNSTIRVAAVTIWETDNTLVSYEE